MTQMTHFRAAIIVSSESLRANDRKPDGQQSHDGPAESRWTAESQDRDEICEELEEILPDLEWTDKKDAGLNCFPEALP